MPLFLALGVVFHLTTIRYELDFWVLHLILAHAACVSVFLLSQVFGGQFSINLALWHALAKGASFHIGLWGSVVIHRLFFHRLRCFPGPRLAKLSRFYVMWTTTRRVQQHLETDILHKRFGDFVRIGPRELSICRASAIPALYGPQTRCRKSPYYGVTATNPGLNYIRDPLEHKRQRRAWDRGLNATALHTYESRIVLKTTEMVEQLRSRCASGSLNMTDWFSFFVFDVMGELGLGKDFNALASGSRNSAMEGIRDVMFATAVFGTIPWFLYLMQVVPGLIPPSLVSFFDYCEKQVNEKKNAIQADSKPEDVLSWLIKASRENVESPPSLPESARLLIIAGSDTTSSLLTNMLYYLLRNPRYMEELTSRLDTLFPDGDTDWSPDKVKTIPLLDDILNETLRLAPSVPGGLPRLTPPEGLTIDGVYIPGDVVVSVPPWTIQRDPRYWEDPDVFKPERWSSGGLNPETVHAYIPFTRGAHACPGKQLARLEMRLIMSRLLLNFRFELVNDKSSKLFEEGQKDTFTLTLPPLQITVTPR
ncbi:cytochrome P450 [Flagelloscypha sp. PMI_526]|nr:cytochrome P450 [Flagelloscypha sp. PMI_526]